jgi:hypothetical protein
LGDVVRSPEIRLEVSNNAKILVNEKLSWKKVAEQSIALYCDRPNVHMTEGGAPDAFQAR